MRKHFFKNLLVKSYWHVLEITLLKWLNVDPLPRLNECQGMGLDCLYLNGEFSLNNLVIFEKKTSIMFLAILLYSAKIVQIT